MHSVHLDGAFEHVCQLTLSVPLSRMQHKHIVSMTVKVLLKWQKKVETGLLRMVAGGFGA
jgi:hypothetical protein